MLPVVVVSGLVVEVVAVVVEVVSGLEVVVVTVVVVVVEVVEAEDVVVPSLQTSRSGRSGPLKLEHSNSLLS
jgi:hypothetical protein